jgi:3-hydroxybutyryl-CoA dehydratase
MIGLFEVGKKYSLNFQVTELVYNSFLAAFKDHNPLHTNNEFALEKGFTSKVMHGNILNGFVSYFIGECLPTKNVIIHAQQIQFNNPVYLNDTLTFEATVAEIFESVNAVEFKFVFKNKDLKNVAKGKVQIGMLK